MGWDSVDGHLRTYFSSNLWSQRCNNRHQVFNPTRSYIWKVYASKLGSQKEGRAALLKAVFEASIIVMKEIYETNMTVNQWAVVNQESLNKRLIELIDARL